MYFVINDGSQSKAGYALDEESGPSEREKSGKTSTRGCELRARKGENTEKLSSVRESNF